ncbi:response regulator [Acidisphaera sp. S103]|uniref:response regulator n=1 Tax=Acidisphaera sp. S103 TaxID=1747223 RepID=UPI00131E069D|nr:response regulator [Acidisphaera sp. S103]
MIGPVLVVDDSLTVRMDLLEILEAAGLQAQACETVAAARQALAREQFALVILDVLLPDGDGIELLKEIRAMPSAAGTAVMLLSTEVEIRDRIHGLTTGADDYVGKPYEPVYLVARARELVRGSGDETASAPLTILLIDDSITFREALKDILEGEGYRVLVTGTGEDGLRVAADQRPAAIIVDGQLPGIDGATVIRRVRLDAALRRLPCLLLTGSEDHSAEVRILDAGADAFVRKEADVDVILARLNAMLRSAGTQSVGPGTPSLLGPKKILAVDDSETYLQELAVALRADGYELVLARSGEEALDLLAVQQVDCLLLDLMMPGIGGLETCRRVKSVPVTRDIPIVMLTALEDRTAMIEGLSSGADDYVAKSAEFDLLRARVLAQIRRKQFADENRMMREQLLLTQFEAAEGRAARQLAEMRAAQLVAESAARRRVEGEMHALIHVASHDLKAPLLAIMHLAQWIGEDIGPAMSPETVEHLGLLRRRVARLQMLMDGLLAYLHVGSVDCFVEDVDIAELVNDIVAMLAPSPGFVVTYDGSLTMLRTYRRPIRVILENLIGNALKHHDRAEGRVVILARLAAGVAEFRVSDDGPGISPRFHDRIFVIFQTLAGRDDLESCGIGLAMVKKIVESHGGHVQVESAPPARGTTFVFTWQVTAS